MSLKSTIYISLEVLDNAPLVQFVKTKCDVRGKTIHCNHATQVFLGRKSKSPDKLKFKVVEAGIKCTVSIDALVVNKKNKSAAFHVSNCVTSNGEKVVFSTGKPHITALVAPPSKPKDSLRYVDRRDDSVLVFPCEFEVNTMCKWV
tara:strand:+ start:147 stop:584 length:438 start_codon:yes stop_codon:yes gene_type:complete